jgi:fatty-acyl-CoA synthase
MSLVEFLDKGASLDALAPCVVSGSRTLTYAEVQALSRQVAGALHGSGIGAADRVAILAGTDLTAFCCVFGVSRLGATWCPLDPPRDAAGAEQALGALEPTCVMFSAAYAPLVEQIAGRLASTTLFVCLDGESRLGPTFAEWLARPHPEAPEPSAANSTAMLIATTGPAGGQRCVELTDHQVTTTSATTVMSYPFDGRPVYLAVVPHTSQVGPLYLPVLALGGRIVLMDHVDASEFLYLVQTHRVTHVYVPPALLAALLTHSAARRLDTSSLQCLWYGTSPVSSSELATAIEVFGPVLARLYGRPEIPMISAMAPADHLRPDGSLAHERLGSAGRPSPLVAVAILRPDGSMAPRGHSGAVAVRGPSVAPGGLDADDGTGADGWRRTGDIGYLTEDNYLFISRDADQRRIDAQCAAFAAQVERALGASGG